MELVDLKAIVTGFVDKSHAEKITIFGWYLHVEKQKAVFSGADIGACYDKLDFVRPASFGAYFKNLHNAKKLIKSGGAYKLEHKVREALEAVLGKPAITVKVSATLAGLMDTIPDMAERDYYKEALTCYNNRAFRATVVMTWNIAFSHLCDHILNHRLVDFNTRWVVSFPGKHKNKTFTIAKMDDFNDELKESEILIVCRDSSIITKNIYNIMHAALGRRNAAAHPNAIIIDKIQTDAYIMDLITNVVLAIK